MDESIHRRATWLHAHRMTFGVWSEESVKKQGVILHCGMCVTMWKNDFTT